jgi:hypothetical protein
VPYVKRKEQDYGNGPERWQLAQPLIPFTCVCECSILQNVVITGITMWVYFVSSTVLNSIFNAGQSEKRWTLLTSLPCCKEAGAQGHKAGQCQSPGVLMEITQCFVSTLSIVFHI